jgi:DNA-binding CsgD family transcriptional regulator
MQEFEIKKPSHLTKRELEVLSLIAQGYTSSDAANTLFISKRTVDFHMANIFAKLKATNRVQAIRSARALGYKIDV